MDLVEANANSLGGEAKRLFFNCHVSYISSPAAYIWPWPGALMPIVGSPWVNRLVLESRMCFEET